MIVEGQIHGGVGQGVGGALFERMAYDESGQLLNASFMDFLMPYASEVPHIETDHLETPSPLNPLGLKGAGEAGCIPVSAVIASAIEDAEGFPITSMPISPNQLWELRRQHALLCIGDDLVRLLFPGFPGEPLRQFQLHDGRIAIGLCAVAPVTRGGNLRLCHVQVG